MREDQPDASLPCQQAGQLRLQLIDFKIPGDRIPGQDLLRLSAVVLEGQGAAGSADDNTVALAALLVNVPRHLAPVLLERLAVVTPHADERQGAAAQEHHSAPALTQGTDAQSQ